MRTRTDGAGPHAFFLALVLVIGGLAAAGPSLLAPFAYARHDVLRGQPWRLLTSHLVHASATHALWNVAGLGLVWIAFAPRLSTVAWLVSSFASALGAALGVLLFHPEIRAMAGASGLLHGLLAAGAVVEVRHDGRLGWLFLAILAAKLLWEQVAGASLLAAAALGGPIALPAHLYGSVAGALAGVALSARTSFSSGRSGSASRQ